MKLPNGSVIDEFESVTIAALVHRIRELERENEKIKYETGMHFLPTKLLPPNELPVQHLRDDIELLRTARWTATRDPYCFKAHAMGVATSADGKSLKYSYFLEDRDIAPNRLADVLTHTHQMMVKDLVLQGGGWP